MSTRTLQLHRSDLGLVAAFAGCTLDEKPGSNWVQDNGGLPDYICRIARAIKRGGKHTTAQAISIAIDRTKMWATGHNVKTDTQAKAAAAVAEWEALKAKAHAKTAAKRGAHVLAATRTLGHDPATLVLAAGDYPVDVITQAFNDRTRDAQRQWRSDNPDAGYDDAPPLLWVKEQWNTFLVVQSDYGRNPALYKVGYEVDPDTLDVTFDTPVEVQTQYIEVDQGELSGADLTDEDMEKLLAMTPPCPPFPVVAKFLALTRPKLSPLEKVLRQTGTTSAGTLLLAASDTAPTQSHGMAMCMSGADMMSKGADMCAAGKADQGKAMIAKGRGVLHKGLSMMDAEDKAEGDDAMGMTMLQLAADASKAPHGDVIYADPGYQADGQKRYPVDTVVHVRAAWSYVSQKDNAAKYGAEDLAKVKKAIMAAAKKVGVEISDS